MRFVIALVLLFLAVPTLRAEDSAPAQPEVRAAVVQPAPNADVPSQPRMVLKEVRVPEQRAAAGAVMLDQDMPRRGSFWWLVGVIVVAGVILAVLLD